MKVHGTGHLALRTKTGRLRETEWLPKVTQLVCEGTPVHLSFPRFTFLLASVFEYRSERPSMLKDFGRN